jgi:hypothetical protein
MANHHHTYSVLSLRTLAVKVETRSRIKALRILSLYNRRTNVRCALFRDGILIQA